MLENKTSIKFKIIHEVIKNKNNILSIAEICKIASVSKSGYFNWVKNENHRLIREKCDIDDFNLILEAFKYRGYDKGAKQIHMTLLHRNPAVIMNVKKIRRLMKKFNLFCFVRTINPRIRIAKALQTNNVAPNILNRNFLSFGPRKSLLTDITYIPYNNSVAYLSVIKDSYTQQILSYVLSESLEIDFVLETVKQLITNYGNELSSETFIHSDRGSHYTSYPYMDIITNNDLRRSMSAKAQCWDNAPQESFFGHMKDHIIKKIKTCNIFNDVKHIIDDYMDYYNNDRYQWNLAKLSPNEYYTYITTHIYPIPIT